VRGARNRSPLTLFGETQRSLLSGLAHHLGTALEFRSLRIALSAAFDGSLKRDVALKIIKPKHLSDPAMRFRPAREAKVVARIQHPGVTALFDTGELDSSISGSPCRPITTRAPPRHRLSDASSNEATPPKVGVVSRTTPRVGTLSA